MNYSPAKVTRYRPFPTRHILTPEEKLELKRHRRKIKSSPEYKAALAKTKQQLKINAALDRSKKYLLDKKYSKALKYLKIAHDNGYDDIDYNNKQIEVLYTKGDFLSCARILKKNIRLLKKRPPSRDRIFDLLDEYILLSHTLYKAGNERQALRHINTAYRYFEQTGSSDSQRVLALSNGLLMLRQNEKAIAVLRPSYDETKDDLLRSNLVVAYKRTKQYSKLFDLIDETPLSQLPRYIHICKDICQKIDDMPRFIKYERRMQLFYHGETTTYFNDFSNDLHRPPSFSINGLTVDLKQLNDGSIRILELNYLPASGLNGYNPYHKTSLQDKIKKDYEQKKKELQALGLRPEDLKSMKYAFTGMGVPEFLTHVLMEYFNDSPVMMNASLNTLTAQTFKDDFVLNCQNMGLHDYIPHSVVVGRNQGLLSALAELSSLKTDYLVFKKSNDAKGEGVEIILARDMPRVVENILNGGAWHGCANPHAWETDYHPNFVVQECVQSKPCKASDGEHYDATMRVALTHIFNHEKDRGDIMIHGMFWKLPRDPIGTKYSRDTVISLAHNERIKKGKPFSARVTPSRQTTVAHHLSVFFNRFGKYMARPNNDVIIDRLYAAAAANHPEQKRHLAHEVITSHPYGNIIPVMANADLHAKFALLKFLTSRETDAPENYLRLNTTGRCLYTYSRARPLKIGFKK